jgi:hypothetical protein
MNRSIYILCGIVYFLSAGPVGGTMWNYSGKITEATGQYDGAHLTMSVDLVTAPPGSWLNYTGVGDWAISYSDQYYSFAFEWGDPVIPISAAWYFHFDSTGMLDQWSFAIAGRAFEGTFVNLATDTVGDAVSWTTKTYYGDCCIERIAWTSQSTGQWTVEQADEPAPWSLIALSLLITLAIRRDRGAKEGGKGVGKGVGRSRGQGSGKGVSTPIQVPNGIRPSGSPRSSLTFFGRPRLA